MDTGGRSFNRRNLLRGIGGAVTLTAVAPAALRSSSASAITQAVLAAGLPEVVGMYSERIEDVFSRVQRRVNDGLFPGATALIARRGVVVGHRAFGNKVAGCTEPVTLDTMFDVLSITKVLATATSVMVLAQQGKLKLSDKVASYLPHFAAHGKAGVTLFDMLRYAAGLPVDNPPPEDASADEAWRLMAETPLEYTPGTSVLYSDLTYRLLGRLVEAVSGTDLNTFAQAHIWGPLGMHDTMYTPPASLAPRIAATGTSSRRGRLVRGEVQDEHDADLGGVTGCDGVFSTAMDVAIFCQMILNRGSYGGARVLSPGSVSRMVQNQTPQIAAAATDTSPLNNLLLAPKGFGWEMWTPRFSHGGTRLSPGSFGKAGGTGAFVWIDPARELFGVLLTNHGLPEPLDELGWNRMIDSTGAVEFFDGVVGAVADDC
ncbi:serine hydrolase [Sorangium cellulosum]|uniref:Serine hydrolase n=1 Tax=Sorangium cellulosum TaxID=56 RepID=A0A2L0F7B5_SORCE|nr:serine hydrolase domain-containing protein [Sorangium cellulosum]AUX47433.1 serine hydrolase [Sorangium cellulosum]